MTSEKLLFRQYPYDSVIVFPSHFLADPGHFLQRLYSDSFASMVRVSKFSYRTEYVPVSHSLQATIMLEDEVTD